MADIFVKQAAKGAQAFEANLEANFGHRELAGNQQFFGFLDPFFDQILMRRLVKRLLE